LRNLASVFENPYCNKHIYKPNIIIMKTIITLKSVLIVTFLMSFMLSTRGQETILEESLRDGSLPSGWAENLIIWETGAGGYARLSDPNSWIQTPLLDLSGYENIELAFDVAKYGSGVDGPITVFVSDDGGSSWTAQTFDSPTPTSSTYLTSGPTLITATGDQIIIKWTRTNSPSQKRLRDILLTGELIGATSPPSISNITQSPETDITSTTTVSVSADITEGDAAIEQVELRWGTTSGEYPNTVTMTASVLKSLTYTTEQDIPTQADGTAVYYVVYAEDVDAESSTSPEQSFEVIDPRFTTLPYVESFDTDLGDSYVYSVLGVTKFWNWNSGGWAQMNGFGSAEIEEDWLILPGFNPDNYEDEVLTFESWRRFGNDDANNYLKLLYSTDYDGIGNPTSATWTELTFTQPAVEQVWTSSGNIDLSAISGTEVWIAFKYRYEPGNYRLWQIDNIVIQEVALEDPDSFFAAAISPSEIGLSFATNMAGNDVIIVFNDTGVFAEPAGTPPAAGQPFAGGTLLYSGTMSPQSHTGLNPEETVYYKAWSHDGANYSPGLTDNATTYATEPSNHVTGFTAMANSSSAIMVSWTDSGAEAYLIKGSTVSPTAITYPADGIPEADGGLVKNVLAGVQSHEFTGLAPGTDHFFKIFPYNGSGATINYKVDEPVPQASSTTDAPPAGYFVDFEGEGETKGAYASGNVNLSGLDWDMTEAVIGTLAGDWKNGVRSARMRGYGSSSMTMLENKSGGIGEVSFLYRRYGTDPQVDWKVEYSTDNGDTWIQIGNDFTAPDTDDVQTFSEVVDVAGAIRIKIKRATEEGSSNNRLNIDDILISDFDGVPENLTVTGITLGMDASECYDATNNITVTNTTIGNNASAEFRAGVSINFGEGFVAESGSFVLALITDVYCSLPESMLASEDAIIPEEMTAKPANDSFFKVYPNPTSNAFTLELTEFDEALKITVEIYGMMGERLLQNELFGSQLYRFDLSTMPKGVYILRVLRGNQTETQKIIRQ
jgi:hypothetical protein